MKEIRDIIRFWEAHRGQPLALATLVATRGSSFRRQGARMLIHSDGSHVGGLSAGCIEEEVVDAARDVLGSSEPRLMTFDTRLRFGCHGTIEIFVEPVREDLMAELSDAYSRRESIRLETIVSGPDRGTRMAEFDEIPGSFVQSVAPSLRLVLIGDGAELTALRGQAAILGWETLHLEADANFPEILDDRTAVVLATHNYGRDCTALRKLLPMGLKYIGLIGSRRRRDDLLFDVLHDGMEIRSSLFAPAGLHLGADAPEEIALSIAAEIQSVFAAGTARPLRETKLPIHHRESIAPPCVRESAV